MAKNFSYLGKTINLHIQEVVWTTKLINPKKPMPRCIIIKPLKTKHKEKTLESSKWVTTHYLYRKQIQMAADFSSEIMEARRKEYNIFLVLKELENPEFYI